MAGLTAAQIEVEIAALERALMSGARVVRYRHEGGSFETEYQSAADLQRALDWARGRLDEMQGGAAGGFRMSVGRFEA